MQQQASTAPRHAVAAVQITINNDPEEIMLTQYGPVNYISWCNKEAARIAKHGRRAIIQYSATTAALFLIRN